MTVTFQPISSQPRTLRAQAGALANDLGAWWLHECLALLPEDRQDMVLLAYYQGWTREELAVQYKRPATTIKTLLRRSLTVLKECLDG